MRAWVGERVDGAVRWRCETFDDPVARAGELLVAVRAVGINRVDQWPKTSHFGHTDPAPAAIPGLEAAGEVVAVGPGVGGWRVGDRVTGMVQGGAAERVRMHAALAIRVPDSLDWTVAAGIPVSYLTAHDALVTHGALPPDGTVLVHAVTSGVGIAAVQIARRRGARLVAGSSGSREKMEALGLDLPIVDPYAGFAPAVLAATGGRGVDVVIDNIGGRILDETLRATAIGGRVIDVGRFGGTRAEIDLDLLAVRRIALIGVTFRTRSLDEHAAVVRAFVHDHATDLATGALAPRIDRVHDFDALPAALERGASRDALGKQILRLRG